MTVDVSPEFAKAFAQTSLLGTKRGRGVYMCKASYKRPKNSIEKQEEAQIQLLKEQEIEDLKATVKALRQQMNSSPVNKFVVNTKAANSSAGGMSLN